MAAPYTAYVSLDERFRYTPYGPVLTYSRSESGVRQKPPYVSTNYQLDIKEALFGDVNAASWAVSPDGIALGVRNKARADFVDKLGNASSFGATLTAERKATWGTVVDGITRAGLAAKAVSRGKLGKAANILGIEPPAKFTKVNYGKARKSKNRLGGSKRSYLKHSYTLPGFKSGSQALGNKWLWYSYGVGPLMKDIYNGMDVLQRPTPSKKFVGKARDSLTVRTTYWIYTYDCSTRCSAEVSVKNPNLWLANQLGLVNPIQMINEGIPFSFVLDWFSNLSQVISQMTDFVGLEIAEPLTTEVCSVIDEQIPPFSPAAKKWTRFKRTQTIPTAKLSFAYERFSWQRGANAVSLLLQFLPKGK